MGESTKTSSSIPRLLRTIDPAWFAVAASLLLVIIIRLHMLHIPLERDEGEFAYIGRLLLRGIPPYAIAWNMKLPGIYAIYAINMAIFGQTTSGIHLGLLFFNAAAIVLVFLLVRRLFNSYAGAVAAAAYAVLSVSISVLGLAAHATQFVVVPALGGILLLLKAIDSGRSKTFFWGGLLLGLAFVIKQPGIVFAAFAIGWLLWAELPAHPRRRCFTHAGMLLLGAIIPLALACFILWQMGVFPRFWFWTFEYAVKYGSVMKPSSIPFSFADGFRGAPADVTPIWVVGLAGLAAVFCDRAMRKRSAFAAGFLLFTSAGVCSGFYFRGHYFVLMLPALALLVGVAADSGRRLMQREWIIPVWKASPVVLIIAILIYPVYAQRQYFVGSSPEAACRMIYAQNPFPESIKIAAFLKSHTSPQNTIAILGSEPQILFYSDRNSATGYMYTYSLMEKQPFALSMQQEMIAQIERARPKYIVFVLMPISWLPKSTSPRLITNWFSSYSRTYYRAVGAVDVDGDDVNATSFYWGHNVRQSNPKSFDRIFIYKRRPGI